MCISLTTGGYAMFSSSLTGGCVISLHSPTGEHILCMCSRHGGLLLVPATDLRGLRTYVAHPQRGCDVILRSPTGGLFLIPVLAHRKRLRPTSTLAHRGDVQEYSHALAHSGRSASCSCAFHRELCYVLTPTGGLCKGISKLLPTVGLGLIPELFAGVCTMSPYSSTRGAMSLLFSCAHGTYLVFALTHGGLRLISALTPRGGLRIYSACPQEIYAMILELTHIGLRLLLVLAHGGLRSVSMFSHRRLRMYTIKSLSIGRLCHVYALVYPQKSAHRKLCYVPSLAQRGDIRVR